jgi:hypothetical protein
LTFVYSKSGFGRSNNFYALGLDDAVLAKAIAIDQFYIVKAGFCKNMGRVLGSIISTIPKIPDPALPFCGVYGICG